MIVFVSRRDEGFDELEVGSKAGLAVSFECFELSSRESLGWSTECVASHCDVARAKSILIEPSLVSPKMGKWDAWPGRDRSPLTSWVSIYMLGIWVCQDKNER